jgi:hypothetical protein
VAAERHHRAAVDQHRVGEAKFADRGGDLRDLLVAVRASVSALGV